MKKILSLLLFFFTVSLFAEAPAGGTLRFDVIGQHFMTKASGEFNTDLSRRKRKSGGKVIHDIFFTGRELDGSWKKMVFSFTPEEDETVNISLRGNAGGSGKKDYPFIHVDALEVTGAVIKNPNFEEFKDGKFKNWSRNKNFQVTKDPKEGKYAVRVNYAQLVSQNIAVKKGVPVKITLWARQENPLVADRGKDGMTNVYVDKEHGSKVLISSGRLLLVPTFENCAYYINRTKKEQGKKCSVKVFYREKGAAKWIEGFEPVNMERENAWRGSLMLLKENTPYEFRAVISGEAKGEILSSFRTRSSNFKVAETIVLNAANFKGQLKNIKSGKAGGYIRYTAEKGFVLKGNKNMYGGVIEAEKAKFVIFEGLTIDANGSRHGIKLSDCSDVIVRNCDISNFGQSDGIRDLEQLGRWTFKNRVTGWDGGIILHGGERQLIERNYIHAPHSTSNSWFYSHPTGPEAIFVDKTKGGTVVRYNDLVGSDLKRWNDAIESSGNGKIDGGFGRDADIYGNVFAYSNDDSIEIEGGEMNIRLYYNLFQGSYCAVSTGCCRLGPSYQFRNIYYKLGDENNRHGINFKNGMGNQGDGAIFIYNNSTYSPNSGTGYGNFHAKDPVYNPPLKAFTRNNIVFAKGTYVAKDWRKWNCNLDNDLFFGAAKEQDNENRAIFKAWGQYKNAIFTDNVYVDAPNGNLQLTKDSPARNRASKIPGTNWKHLGAHQDDGLVIPYRPIPAFTDKNEINFNPANQKKTFNFTLTAKGKNFKESFKVRCNDDFFTVTPAEGVLKSGEKITFTVKCNPDKIKQPRIHNGMILVRFESGFSRHVTVYADFRADKGRIADMYRHSSKVENLKVSNKGVYTGKVTIPEKGCYFVFAEGTVSGWARTDVAIGKVKTNSKARFISKTPGLGCVRNGHLSGWYFFLDKGTFDFSFTTDMKDAKINNFYITKEPEWFLR